MVAKWYLLSVVESSMLLQIQLVLKRLTLPSQIQFLLSEREFISKAIQDNKLPTFDKHKNLFVFHPDQQEDDEDNDGNDDEEDEEEEEEEAKPSKKARHPATHN